MKDREEQGPCQVSSHSVMIQNPDVPDNSIFVQVPRYGLTHISPQFIASTEDFNTCSSPEIVVYLLACKMPYCQVKRTLTECYEERVLEFSGSVQPAASGFLNTYTSSSSVSSSSGAADAVNRDWGSPLNRTDVSGAPIFPTSLNDNASPPVESSRRYTRRS